MAILELIIEAAFSWLEFQVDDCTCLNNRDDSYPSLGPSVAIHHLVSIGSISYIHCG